MNKKNKGGQEENIQLDFLASNRSLYILTHSSVRIML